MIRPFNRRAHTATLLLVSFFFAAISMPARLFAAGADEVDSALQRAKAFVYSQQTDGLWEKRPSPPTDGEVRKTPSAATAGQWGGETALAVYALLAAGESPRDPRLATAIRFLRTAELRGTYALGMRAQLWTFLPTSDEVRRLAAADVVRFETAVIKKQPTIGLFDYLLDSQRTTRFDHSASQYGVLGMWACERAGAEVPTGFWQTVENAWNRDQAPDGSWSYGRTGTEKYPETASMTMAGVASLFITQDYLHGDDGANCSGNIINPHIDAGLKWIDTHFEQVFSDKGLDAPYYGLYGVERVGVASGQKYLGRVDWYQRGSDFLVQNQSARGSWSGVPGTCFAMLFLSRGRAPVLFSKLQYNAAGQEANWNQRPRDIANLTHWMSTQTERDLNWQIVNLQGPLSDLLEAPVLVLSGNRALSFTPVEEKKLRDYCQAGGLILGNPDCGSSAFAGSFRKLGSHLFHDFEFRNLPARHPIYTDEQYPRSKWKPAPTLLGLGNGVRELMLLTNNSDPARSWQLQEAAHHLPDFELADDVALYAVDKNNLQVKGKSYYVTPDPAIATNRIIKLARLQFNGNWDPEPGGWRRMAAILRNKCRIDLQVSVTRLGAGQLGDGRTGATAASWTGTGEFRLSSAQRREIWDFVTGGGMLIVDAAGGNSDFAASVENELQAIFGTDAGRQLKLHLPASSAIFHLRGGEIQQFGYRSFARLTVGSTRSPLLAAIKIGQRVGVYYSRLDLSAGLVGEPTDGIIGYDPATATAIMTNLVVAGGLGEKASVSPTP